MRNGQANDYPFLASIQSVLPLVDEMIIALGPSEDATLELLQSLSSPKIRVIKTVWNDNMRDQGFLYGQQKMIAQYNCTGDWAFYLEADEVLHETEIPVIRKAMQKYVDDPAVEALVLDYLHFFGSPGRILQSHRWYPREVRIIKTSVRTICPDNLWWEVLEADGTTRFPKAALAGAHVYHYGWLRQTNHKPHKHPKVRKPKSSKPSADAVDPDLLHDFPGLHPEPVLLWLHGKVERVYQLLPEPIIIKQRGTLKSRMQELLSALTTPEHFTLVK